MSSRPPLLDDDELLAAELALDLLAGDERRDAERRAETDAAFAAALARWRERAALLLDDAGETPPASVWEGIRAKLPANDAAPARDIRRWQLATALASACALALGVLLVTRPAAPPPPPPAAAILAAPVAPPLVAVLRGEASAVVAVSFERASRRLTITPSSLVPERRSAELWVIPRGGTPYSLGLVDPARPRHRVATPAAAGLIAPGATLAISLEPSGGSPHGQPTGPIVLTGKLDLS